MERTIGAPVTGKGGMKSPILWFCLILLMLAIFTAVGPTEKTLGTSVRVVYLHGAWVWAALTGFLVSGILGVGGLVTQRDDLQRWSRSLGRAALFFWITYLPISMWAMQTNWNGLFLAEPRWRLAIVFAIGGLLLQLGLVLVEAPAWASAANIIYFLMLFLALRSTQNIMHPPSPILNSDARLIQLYFFGLLALTLLAGWQVARWWHRFER